MLRLNIVFFLVLQDTRKRRCKKDVFFLPPHSLSLRAHHHHYHHHYRIHIHMGIDYESRQRFPQIIAHSSPSRCDPHVVSARTDY